MDDFKRMEPQPHLISTVPHIKANDMVRTVTDSADPEMWLDMPLIRIGTTRKKSYCSCLQPENQSLFGFWTVLRSTVFMFWMNSLMDSLGILREKDLIVFVDCFLNTESEN